MKRRTRLASLAALGLAATSTACTVDGNGLVILENTVADQDCLVNPDSIEFRSIGNLDVSIGAPYLMFPVVENDLSSTAAQTVQEQNRVFINRVEIDLENGTGSALPVPAEFAKFQQGASGSVDPDGGRTALAIELVPAVIVQAIRDGSPGAAGTLIASVRVVGETLGGGDVRSQSFTFPIQVCDGCLAVPVDCSGGINAADLNQDLCSLQDQFFSVCQ